ncbi:MAG: protein kinase family protein [Desulfovibrio sp.]
MGQGANSTVYRAECEDGGQYAIKVRHTSLSQKQQQRFLKEIEILTSLKGTKGVIDIQDSFGGDDACPPFYTMDIGIPALEWAKEKKEPEIAFAFLEIANTLERLKAEKTSHRDIKPENIIFINDKPYLSDFGLAHKEGEPRLTLEGDKQIGAKMTMAPEMVRDPYSADYYKADSYSLAKTLWILLTKDQNCFEGCYSTHGQESLWNYDVEILGDIEAYMTNCTSNSPDLRWSYDKSINFFKEWLDITNEDGIRSKEAWRLLKKRIFPFTQPEIAEWSNLDDIVRVFELVVNKPCWNHSFFPDGGGLDLSDVKKSEQTDCLEFVFHGFVNIIKPKKLSFYSPGGDDFGEQDYFILEADELDFISDQSGINEVVTQLSATEFTDPNCADWNDYNGEKLPEGARLLVRWRQGKFAIFMGASLYNQKGILINGKLVDAYEAPHNSIDQIDFFNFFKKVFKNKDPESKTTYTYKAPTSTRLKKQLLSQAQTDFIRQFISDLSSIEGDERKTLTGELTKIDWKKANSTMKKKRDLVKRLSDEELQLLNAVMYSGRNNKPPYGLSLDEQLPLHPIRNENEDAITGKAIPSVRRYLQDGLDMYT